MDLRVNRNLVRADGGGRCHLLVDVTAPESPARKASRAEGSVFVDQDPAAPARKKTSACSINRG